MELLNKIMRGETENYIAPFLWLHNEENKLIVSELQRIRSSGIKAVCIESRTHEEFCREDWWSDVRLILDACKRLGMGLWILDDKHFPSGYANGIYEKEENRHLRALCIRSRRVDIAGPIKSCSILADEWRELPDDEFFGAFAFRRSALTSVQFGAPYGWSAGGVEFTATELSKLGVDYLTLGYYKSVWVRNTEAEEEELDESFFTGGMCNTTVKWTLTYTDETKTKLKLTVSGSGAMPDYGTGEAPWYEYLNDIVEIEVCEGITEVGRCAFYGLKFVKTVTLAEGIVSIGDYAFNGCFSLKSIVIPESVTYISDSAFTKTGLSEIPEV